MQKKAFIDLTPHHELIATRLKQGYYVSDISKEIGVSPRCVSIYKVTHREALQKTFQEVEVRPEDVVREVSMHDVLTPKISVLDERIEDVAEMISAGVSHSKMANILGVSVSSLERFVREHPSVKQPKLEARHELIAQTIRRIRLENEGKFKAQKRDQELIDLLESGMLCNRIADRLGLDYGNMMTKIDNNGRLVDAWRKGQLKRAQPNFKEPE